MKLVLDAKELAVALSLPVTTIQQYAIGRIRELEQRSKQLHQTQVLIETPYRNAALAEALLHTLHPSTRLSISSGLTLARAWSRTHRVADWRPQSQALMQALADKVPAVFYSLEIVPPL